MEKTKSVMAVNLGLIKKIDGIVHGDYFEQFSALYMMFECRKQIAEIMQSNVITDEHLEVLNYYEEQIKRTMFLM